MNVAATRRMCAVGTKKQSLVLIEARFGGWSAVGIILQRVL